MGLCVVALGCAGSEADTAANPPGPGLDASHAETGSDATPWPEAASDAIDDGISDVSDAPHDVPWDAPDSAVPETGPDAFDAADDADAGPWIPTYPSKRVGIFYLAWHAYAADAVNQLPAQDQLTIEDVIRSPSLHFTDVLHRHGLLNQATWFHYHAKPQLGFYCLYRKRPADAFVLNDCPGIAQTAATHAQQLWDAGIDFVYLDLTNFPVFSTASDVMALRPLEVLLEEWAALRAAGHPTPQVAAWLPIPSVAAGETPMYQKVLEVYGNPAFDGLLLTHAGQKVMFIVDHGGLPIDAGHMADIQTHGHLPVRMWGNLDDSALSSGTSGWMQPCRQGGTFTTLVRPDSPCQQGYTASSPLGTVLSVSASYQVGYASLPYQASGRLGGLTFKKQFETAFAVQPSYLIVNAWNEHIAQPQANPHDASLGSLRRSMGETDVPAGDPGADWLWVDMYGRDLSRDIEPSVQDGGAAYELLKSCLRVYRSGHTSCTAQDQQSEACCQLGAGMHLVRSLRHVSDGGQMNTDHVVTLSENERDALVATGVWTEVCNLLYGPPGLCGGGTTGDGPFSLFADGGSGRTALYRCYTGADHFISTSATCEGTQTEGPLGWASDVRTSETPRPLRRCYNASALAHFHWLDEHCPALPGVQEEAILGFVR